ncbi:pyridoxamine 5'-phosphate oxidase family protein [Nocardioides daphniae]|uniref:General stress protein n=1 Tax=Nocardioides daphniae TaxID=402297 RepID=A0A4P7UCD6_9ACTN|nr:pyridoxamine 5'-phosphate oxidase family protein [Nocardioides daphniae]QCC77863.1 pyridoxamine 5'-phosphate oxidase [Nocardioides daphniae]GGD27614.1 general stress protein [Nocardioides daphniae]
MTDHDEAKAELRKRVEGQRFVMFTTATAEGTLTSRPMTVQEVDGWTLRFITQDSNTVTPESEGKQVNLAFMDGGNYVSLSGTGSVSRDVQQKRELWDRLNEAYAGEPEDPDNVILDVHVDEGEYWDGGNPVARVVGLAKAAITGDPPSGKHAAVDI